MPLPAKSLRFAYVLLLALVGVTSASAARLRTFLVPPAATNQSDHSAFDEAVAINGRLVGDVQLVGGSLNVNGVISGDVVTLGTDVTFGPQGRVDGDVIILGGSADGVRDKAVRGDLVIKASESHAGTDVSLRSLGKLSMLSIALQLILLLGWVVVAIVTTLVAGKEIRASSLELRASPLHTFVLGLVAFTSVVLTLVVLSFLIPYLVGVPLIIVVGVAAIMAKLYGMVTVFHAIGSRLFAARSRDQLKRREWMRGDLALVIAGLIVLGLVRLIPVVGTFLWMMASVFGIGSALATKFGRREPWFLAVRPVTY